MAFKWAEGSRDFQWPEDARTPVKAHTRKARIGAAIGGTVGGLAGLTVGPGAVVASPLAAGAGAAIGESFQRSLEGENLEPESVLKEAGIQAALEAGGGLVGRGIKAAARPLMQAALRSTPEVAKTAVTAGVTATKEGMKKILDRIGQAGQVAMGITRQATAQGMKYDQLALAKDIYRDMAPAIRGLPGDAARRSHLRRLGLQFLGENPRGPISATQLHLAKQRADALAAPLYKTLNAGGKLTDRESLDLQWYKKFADKSRELLEPLPGYKDVNDVTRSLIETKDALSHVSRKGRSFGQVALERGTLPVAGAGIGATRGETSQERAVNAALGAGIGAGIGTPQSLSWLALQTQNPAVASIIAGMLRGGRLASQ